MVEPVAANMGLVPPAEGFLDGLRQACDKAGALLIFDEVITGFRLGPGGAQARFGVTPDLSTFGKIIGGGLPLAAFGGRADVMSVLAPGGPVYQAGTLSGNPLATAAGLAVLDLLDDAAYVQLAGRAAELAANLTTVITEAGLPVQVPTVGPLMGLFFADEAPHDYASAKQADGARYARFFHHLLDRGVALAPSPFEALFPSLAHTKEELERTVDLAAAAARATATDGRNREPPTPTSGRALRVRRPLRGGGAFRVGQPLPGRALLLLLRLPLLASHQERGHRQEQDDAAEHADAGHRVAEPVALLAHELGRLQAEDDDLLDGGDDAGHEERLRHQPVLDHRRPHRGQQLQQDEHQEQPVEGVGDGGGDPLVELVDEVVADLAQHGDGPRQQQERGDACRGRSRRR